MIGKIKKLYSCAIDDGIEQKIMQGCTRMEVVNNLTRLNTGFRYLLAISKNLSASEKSG